MKRNIWIVKSIKDDIIEIYEDGNPGNLKEIKWSSFKSSQFANKQKLGISEKLRENEGKYSVISKKWLIMVLSAVLSTCIAFGVYFQFNKDKEPVFNRYVEEISETENINTDSNKLRFRFNTTITVKKNTLQNINLESVNKGKDIQMKMKYKDNYIFDSGLIAYGKVLKSEVLLKELPKGIHSVVAEIYTYDSNKELTNQTNFNIKLNVQE